jgi:hypothetical protein
MTESALLKKLGVKPGYRFATLNVPAGCRQYLAPLPENVSASEEPGGENDVVLAFAATKSEADRLTPDVLRSAKRNAAVWVAYPKKTSKLNTDLNRDSGWDAFADAGWRIVSIAAIDDTWAVCRFRPVEDVKSR